jgi:hypothetical protein
VESTCGLIVALPVPMTVVAYVTVALEGTSESVNAALVRKTRAIDGA